VVPPAANDRVPALSGDELAAAQKALVGEYARPERCGNCNAFEPLQPNAPAGQCRARPPFPAMTETINEVPMGLFPVMREIDWCRGFVPVRKTVPRQQR
jgi:hypothetical protein